LRPRLGGQTDAQRERHEGRGKRDISRAA
jgi:hypothetical protein